MEQVYTSKIDTWLAVVLLAAVIACLVAFGLSFSTGSVAQIVATFPAILIGAALPIKKITSITPTSSPLSSPALSLDRLHEDIAQHRISD